VLGRANPAPRAHSTGGQHLLALINDILDLSKVEAGKMILELEPVPVSSLLVNSLSIVREKAASRRISLSIDAAADLGSVQMDARKVKQIVYNLLKSRGYRLTGTNDEAGLATAVREAMQR
jgi:signal transduction histidine kinase